MKNIAMKRNADACFDKLVSFGAIRNVPMSEHTSFRIGGPADIFFVPHNEQELLYALNCAETYDMPVFIMGNGSNLLVNDNGIHALVIKLRETEPHILFDTDKATMNVSASTLFSAAVKRSVENGFMGLEWGAGIPGTVGGAIAMNAGAYGGEIKNSILSISALIKTDTGYEHKDFTVQDGDFAYRYSKYAYPDSIVLNATFALAPDDGEAHMRMEDYTRRRIAKQPLAYPSAGSVFKRPEGHYAGALIEEAGLKGQRIGGAQVSELHAGFIINTGGATAADVLALIDLIKKRVYENSGVKLEEELRITGG